MEDICDIFKRLAKPIWAGEVWYDGEVKVGCVLRKQLAQSANLFFFAYAQTDFVTRDKALANDVRADEASCAGDEDERFGHYGCDSVDFVSVFGKSQKHNMPNFEATIYFCYTKYLGNMNLGMRT